MWVSAPAKLIEHFVKSKLFTVQSAFHINLIITFNFHNNNNFYTMLLYNIIVQSQILLTANDEDEDDVVVLKMLKCVTDLK